VKYNLFTGPGFTISDVIIYDDPALSAEPILYTAALTAIPRIWPLFAGRLAFSSIRLEDAHINLGRTASPEQPAHWNVAPLTHPALFRAFPNISVVSGGVSGIPKSRINFKIGGTKTVFYILIDKLEVRPPSTESGPWGIRLEGEPARTDRPALGFGSFVVEGQWLPAQGVADIRVQMERSEVSDIIALLNGHDAGIHGSATGSARFVGPMNGLKINGRIEVSGIHGFDQMASQAQRWPLEIAGTWNVPEQLFDLSARLAGQPNSPVQARFQVADYLGAPHWGLAITCHAMPLEPLLPLGRQVGLAIPDGIQLQGTLDGAVSIARTGPSDGSARITNASLSVAGAPPVEFEEAQLIVADGHAHLLPSRVRTADIDANAQEGTIESDLDLVRHALQITLASRGMEIGKLQSGTWKGQLTYTYDPALPPTAGRWSGAVDIQKATLALPFLTAPVRVASAHAEMEASNLTVRKIQARVGDLAATGDYRYELGADRPHRFHLSVARVTGVQLDALFRPALYRGGLASRLGLKRSDPPEWLTQMRADGLIEAASVNLGGLDFEHVTSRMIWDGVHVKLADTKARYAAANLAALLEADLSGNAPSYHGAGNISGLAWKGGKVDANLTMDTSGAGLETLTNLRAEGSFHARDVDLDYPSMEGCFQFLWGGKSPRVKLSSLQVSDGEEVFVGTGSTAANGELVLDLAGVAKPVRLTLR
jgi:hypothetical protein